LLFLLRLPAALRRRLVSTARRAAPGRCPPGGGRTLLARRRRRARPGRRRRRDGAVPLVADADRQVARAVLARERAAPRARLHALEYRSAVGVRLDHAQLVEVEQRALVLAL